MAAGNCVGGAALGERNLFNAVVLMRSEDLRFRASWIALLVVGVATLGYGLVVVVLPSSGAAYLRAIGATSIGMGLFGVMITVTAFRRRERWAFYSLCSYPLFWTRHPLGNLPPSRPV